MKDFPRNPFVVHQIQDRLNNLNGFDLLTKHGIIGAAIISYKDSAIDPLIKILHKEDRQKVLAIIGEKTMKLIDEYIEDETQDIPEHLFTSPGPQYPSDCGNWPD